MFYLKRNLPSAERAIRLGLGACMAFITLKFLPVLWVAMAGYATAATLAGTAVIGFCPACALLGRKTLNRKS